ncbi:trigger factor [Cronbergia sp. UHCC 0137]|uniref:trigger factor n=1 Tax=Cronbergia sp. UHCC 0137 TaxID=3110239 RepID=UPI002B209033|nr:trigger factor [Cronbergia sp. UHCC 0137]MEA5616651.1 trigger factor [Cronbergia sp. UHCC 0137]
MKVTQEKLPASQIGLEIEITPEITKQKYDQVIKKLTTTANIPGFRKGKVPRQILLQRLGISRIKATVLEEIIPDGIEQAVKQAAITAIGQPRLLTSFEDLISKYEPGKPLTISISVDVAPEINITQYTGFQVQAEEIKYDPTRVDQLLDQERQKMATLVPVEGREARFGDVAIVDFKGVLGKVEGEDESSEPKPIPGGDATDFQVELQEDKFIPGFISGMIGMNPGETREVAAQFPDPYGNNELAGKAALFTVTLKEIKQKELPELDDDFAQEVSDFETMGELRSSLEERYQKEAADQTKINQQEALLRELLKHVEIDLPETLVEKEIDMMVTQSAMRLSEQGIDVKKLLTQQVISELRERSRPDAIERIKRFLCLEEISKRESITVTKEEIEVRLTELLEQYTDEEIDQDRLRLVVADELLSGKVLNWLVENSSVELVTVGSVSATQQTESEPPSTETTIDIEAVNL